ncbi:MAG: YcxB family protein [Anaerolineales bacterium]|nr:YcxB family protein [Anaerolineales bacterium]
MQIAFAGSFSQEEFFAAAKFIESPKTGSRPGAPSPAFLWLGFGIDYLALFLASLAGYKILGDWIYLAVAAIALLPGLILTRQGVQWLNRAHEAWNQNPRVKKHRRGTASEDFIETAVEGETVRSEWSGYGGFGESGDLILLVHESGQTVLFPKSHFASEADWSEFRCLVKRKLPETHALPPRNPWKTAKQILPAAAFHLFLTGCMIGWIFLDA